MPAVVINVEVENDPQEKIKQAVDLIQLQAITNVEVLERVKGKVNVKVPERAKEEDAVGIEHDVVADLNNKYIYLLFIYLLFEKISILQYYSFERVINFFCVFPP